MKQIIALSSLAMLGACGDRAYEEAAEATSQSTAELYAVVQASKVQRETVVIADADKGRACRAIIAGLNGRDPGIIRVISSEGDQYRVRYTRDDGTVWTNDCIVGNGTAQWRMVENGQPGRWRNEDTINFTIEGEKIDVQTYMDGELITSDSYDVN